MIIDKACLISSPFLILKTSYSSSWRKDQDPTVRMLNPTLQILYDEVLVFHLETAINENAGHYSNGRWNQFRLFSR